MKLIQMTSPNCKANLEFTSDRKVAFCSYCGTKLLIDDENINVNLNYHDEAKVMEARNKKSEIDIRLKRYEAEDLAFQEKYSKWRAYLNVWKKYELLTLAAAFLCLIVPHILRSRRLFDFLEPVYYFFGNACYYGLIFGGGFLYFTNPKKRYEKLIEKREEYEIKRLEAMSNKNKYN